VTREDAIRLAREVVERTTDVHEYHGIPARFDPHEWVIEAIQLAHHRGFVEHGVTVTARITDEQASLALRSGIGRSAFSCGYTVEAKADPAAPADPESMR